MEAKWSIIMWITDWYPTMYWRNLQNNLFRRKLVSLVRFKSTSVYYERHERIAGESYYLLRKMLALAFDGITSLSVKQMHLIIGSGSIFCAISLFAVIAAGLPEIWRLDWPELFALFWVWIFLEWESLENIQEKYIWKIYMETKKRSRYIISEKTYENE